MNRQHETILGKSRSVLANEIGKRIGDIGQKVARRILCNEGMWHERKVHIRGLYGKDSYFQQWRFGLVGKHIWRNIDKTVDTLVGIQTAIEIIMSVRHSDRLLEKKLDSAAKENVRKAFHSKELVTTPPTVGARLAIVMRPTADGKSMAIIGSKIHIQFMCNEQYRDTSCGCIDEYRRRNIERADADKCAIVYLHVRSLEEAKMLLGSLAMCSNCAMYASPESLINNVD